MSLADIPILLVFAFTAFVSPIDEPKPCQGIVVAADKVTADSLAQWAKAEQQVILNLSTCTDDMNHQAANLIQASGLEIGYFIEVGRCPELADAHPEWMASLQGHPEWRRLFPDFPATGANQVVKNYPWVPVYYREALDAHRERIRKLLDGKPAAKRIWLNDIQGGPSACGCGHPLCRWTADYGPIKTARTIGDTGPAEFVQTIRELAPNAEVIPILTTECELDDKEHECAGVNCFEGICWKAFSKQLAAIDTDSPRIGLACFYREFGRDLERYGDEAVWVRTAVQSLETMPPKRSGKAIGSDRVIAVLQGWNVNESEIEQQKRMALESGAGGWLLVQTPIDQSWKPRMFDYDPEKVSQFASESEHSDHGKHDH